MTSHNSFKSLKVFLFLVVISFSCNQQFSEKVRTIKNMSISDIQLVYDTTALRIAGNKFHFGIKVKTADGLEYSTTGWSGGTLSWSNFKIRVDGGTRRSDKIIISKDLSYSVKEISIKVNGSRRQKIDTTFHILLNQVTDIKLEPLNQIVKAPGRYIDFGIRFYYDCGKTVFHERWSKRKRAFNQFDIFTDGGNFDNNKFYITKDIFSIIDHQVGMLIVFKEDKSIRDTFEILLDYKDNYLEYFSGQNGFDGNYGYDGYDGNDAGCEGCQGENGEHGEPGTNGYSGFDGPDINVYAEAYYDNILNCDLLKVRVENCIQSFSTFYLVNPMGGNISITSVGGAGGHGGYGGKGGDGGIGGPGERYTIDVEKYVTETDTSGKEVKKLVIEKVEKQRQGGKGGNGGNGGLGGNGGDGGNGGQIKLFYTGLTKKYLSVIRLSSQGGTGGFEGQGGSRGDAGSGGNGKPNGSNGYCGSVGFSGNYGYPGFSGDIYRTLSNNKAWD